MFLVEHCNGESEGFQTFDDKTEALNFYKECIKGNKYETVKLSEVLEYFSIWDNYFG